MRYSMFPGTSKKMGDNIIDFDTHEQLVKGMFEPGILYTIHISNAANIKFI
jgi:hypothetical protein